MPEFYIGKSSPSISIDTGSGRWCSEVQSSQLLVYKRALQMALSSGALDTRRVLRP
jgi:hypothetical protein